MKSMLAVAAALAALTSSAYAGGWSQTNPDGYTFGRTAGGRAFWSQTTPGGYTYGHVDAPTPDDGSPDDGFAACTQPWVAKPLDCLRSRGD
jgi:hypothetical protein